MRDENMQKIEEIIGAMKCPKNFKCVESGFKNLCKAKNLGLKSYLQCIEENPLQCKFAFPNGEKYFCKCPLRVYLAKKWSW
jgi:hypothetical protein